MQTGVSTVVRPRLKLTHQLTGHDPRTHRHGGQYRFVSDAQAIGDLDREDSTTSHLPGEGHRAGRHGPHRSRRYGSQVNTPVPGGPGGGRRLPQPGNHRPGPLSPRYRPALTVGRRPEQGRDHPRTHRHTRSVATLTMRWGAFP